MRERAAYETFRSTQKMTWRESRSIKEIDTWRHIGREMKKENAILKNNSCSPSGTLQRTSS
jgi:hypothetical protein